MFTAVIPPEETQDSALAPTLAPARVLVLDLALALARGLTLGLVLVLTLAHEKLELDTCTMY